MSGMEIEIFFLAVLSFSVCQAQMRCYVCTTSTGPHSDQCGDDFRLTSVDGFTCQGTCQKTRGIRTEGGRQVIEITRGCVPYTSEGCRKGTYLGVSADICTCNEQLCNNADGRRASSKQALILSGLAMTLCHLFVKIL